MSGAKTGGGSSLFRIGVKMDNQQTPTNNVAPGFYWVAFGVSFVISMLFGSIGVLPLLSFTIPPTIGFLIAAILSLFFRRRPQVAAVTFFVVTILMFWAVFSGGGFAN